MDRVQHLGDVAEIMLDNVENKTTFRTGEPLKVSSRSYTDKDQFNAEITQVPKLFPGPTPDCNRTVLNYLRRNPIKDEAAREAAPTAMNVFRDVTYQEDYVIGLDVQKGLQSGAHDEIVFGRNERGNQYFHEWLNWYLEDDPSGAEPVL